MKVVSPKEMSVIESHAYRDGSSEEDFMEEAGSGVALVVHDFAEHYNIDRRVVLLCGKGNNAGDAYVAGVHLLHLDYEVTALQLFSFDECSRLCQQNYHRFLAEGGRTVEVLSAEDVGLPDNGIIVDGIFGTGFHGSVEESLASIIRLVNQSNLPVIAVDIPSGLDGETGKVESDAIVATETIFLGLPKTGFFLESGWNHVGKLRYIDFGLPYEYIEEASSDLIMLSNELMRPLLPKIIRNRNKYQTGYVVGLTGSLGFPGAVVLSSLASLQGGAGIVRVLYPEEMRNELTSMPAELIKIAYHPAKPDEVLTWLNSAGANYIGPGIGRSPQTIELLKAILPHLQKPCVIDADALTLIASENIPIPEHAVLTPHSGEMRRLLHAEEPLLLNKETFKRCQDFAETHGITLVLKGGPTFIFHPGEPVMVNPKGDPGMATAGSGDVLTGLIAALLAQGLSPHSAAALGVYMHGIAGEHAAEDLTSYCVIASDILYHFPEAFRLIEL